MNDCTLTNTVLLTLVPGKLLGLAACHHFIVKTESSWFEGIIALEPCVNLLTGTLDFPCQAFVEPTPE